MRWKSFSLYLRPVRSIIVSVTNDLVTDQRVHKVCMSWLGMGIDPLLVGRRLPSSLPLERPYRTHRMRLLFRRGFLFYAEYNFRLFLFLLFRRCDGLLANDLDTLLANYLVSVFWRKPLIYDSHELFTEVPEIQHRPFVKRTWERLEGWIFPRLKHVYTVNEHIADIYRQKYGVPVAVVRNLPLPRSWSQPPNPASFDLPADRFIIIMQGAGINVDRGAEELVAAMHQVDGALLIIAGSGDVLPLLKEKVASEGLDQKVRFVPRLPHEQLLELTRCAHLGATLDKDTNLNYRYSLPNKLFDYIQCEVPVLASNLVEVRKVVETYGVGVVVDAVAPDILATSIRHLMADAAALTRMREACRVAAPALTWDTKVLELIVGGFESPPLS